MLRKISFCLLTTALGAFLFSPMASAQEKSTTTTTTTIEATTVKPAPAPAKKSVAPKPVVKKAPAAPATTATSVTSTTTTTEVVKPPPPPQMVARKPYDEETLEKMRETICAPGFKAYVGTDKKNVCLTKATAPDIAYSCVWDKDGPPAFAATTQGPCNLDFTEHRGRVVIKKETFADDPPLSYGKEAICCYRAAVGPALPVAAQAQ